MPDIIGVAPSNLLVDEANPRLLEPNKGQRPALRALAQSMPRKILALAKDIVQSGINPGDLMYVVSASNKKDENRYIVLEGNRRVVALKALENADTFVGALDPTTLQQMRELSREYQKAPIDNISCVRFNDKKEAEHWISLRHTGENNGAGIVPWGGDEANRFRARAGLNVDLSTQALDFLQSQGMLTNEERQRVSASNLKRLLGDPVVREPLGFGLKDGTLEILAPAKQVSKALKHVVMDLANPDGTKVKKIYNKAERKKYADELPEDIVVKATATEGKPLSELKKSAAKPKAKPRPPQPRVRDHLIPTDCVLQATKGRLQVIEIELRNLSIKSYANAVAVLLRVFVELSMDEYVKRRKLPVNEKSTLGHKMNEVAKDLISQAKITDKQAKIVTKAATKGSYIGPSIELMHDFIHHTEVFPVPGDLRAHWDTLQPFMIAVWSK